MKLNHLTNIIKAIPESITRRQCSRLLLHSTTRAWPQACIMKNFNIRLTRQKILDRDHARLYVTILHITQTVRQILLRNLYS